MPTLEIHPALHVAGTPLPCEKQEVPNAHHQQQRNVNVFMTAPWGSENGVAISWCDSMRRRPNCHDWANRKIIHHSWHQTTEHIPKHHGSILKIKRIGLGNVDHYKNTTPRLACCHCTTHTALTKQYLSMTATRKPGGSHNPNWNLLYVLVGRPNHRGKICGHEQ